MTGRQHKIPIARDFMLCREKPTDLRRYILDEIRDAGGQKYRRRTVSTVRIFLTEAPEDRQNRASYYCVTLTSELKTKFEIAKAATMMTSPITDWIIMSRALSTFLLSP